MVLYFTEQGALIPPPKKKIPGIGLPGMGGGMPGGLLAEMKAKKNMQVCLLFKIL